MSYRLTVNGATLEVEASALRPLATVLRDQGLTGTKVCCFEGRCGSCTVLVDGEPAFRRSRSVAIPFLRSRFAGDRDSTRNKPPTPASRSKSSFWSAFRTHKNKKGEDDAVNRNDAVTKDDYAQRMMMRSRSVSVPVTSRSVSGSSSAKGRSWYFPSPIQVFRQSKTSKVVQERSPLR